MLESADYYLNVVKKQFPDFSTSIEMLYLRNSDFRLLCKEYESCLQHQLKFENEITRKKDDLEEYEELRKELDKELIDFIKQFNSDDKEHG